MAVDTAQRRFSMIALCTNLAPLYEPNADAISEPGQRAQFIHLYGGLDLSGSGGGGATTDRRRRAVMIYRRYLQGGH